MATGTQTRHRTSLNRNRALGVVGAVVAALAVWLVADPILGADMTVTQPGRDAIEVGIGAVVFMSLVAALLGWASVAVLERLTARGTQIWVALAAVVLVLSFFPVAGVTATGGAKVALGLMHIAVAAVLIPMFWRTRPRAER